MVRQAIKLSEWATQHGLTYKGAYRMYRAGDLPWETTQLPTGTILVHPPEVEGLVVIYCRVSSHDQSADLDRQSARLRDFAAAKGWQVAREVREIGSGLNGRRPKLIKLLQDIDVQTIVVEHRDRLTRFGFEYLAAALKAQNRELVVVNATESNVDLMQDFIDVVTSMCARIYGKRSAKNKAIRALEAANED